MLGMLRMLGSGSTPLHRLRIGLDFVLSGRKELDGMIARHAELARSLGEELGLDDDVLAALGGVATSAGTAGASRTVSPERTYRSRHASRTSPSSSRWPTGPTASRPRSRWAAVVPGTQFDPALVEIVEADAEKVFHQLDELDSWDAVIDGEPGLARTLSAAECDEALAAIARFVDLKSPSTLGHSEAVARLAASAAAELGLPPAEQRLVRRAGLVAGLGRLGVSNAIWDKPGPLSAAEWERARLYPHYTERMLHRSRALAPAGRLAGQVAERLDGSGYPGGLRGRRAQPDQPDRGHRRRCSRPSASPDRTGRRSPSPTSTRLLRDDVRAGRLDGTVVDAVLRAAGERVQPSPGGPGGPHRQGDRGAAAAWCVASRTGRSRRRW